MGLVLKAVEITKYNLDILKSFIAGLDDEKSSFRYFDKRGIDAVRNHLYTVVLLSEDLPISYGHLDREGDTIWLGIIVKSKFQGQGISKRMMTLLLDRGKDLHLNDIYLSVDLENLRAISLYKKFGFEQIAIKEKFYILKKKL